MDPAKEFESKSTYHLQRKIGGGGSAEVFLYTRQTAGLPDQEVVLKVIKANDESLIRELLNEGRRLSRLKHPNIVTTFGYERISNDKFGLVLEYIPGQNLQSVLTKIPANLRPAVAAYVVRIVCEALAAAHGGDVVHGDVSGRNVLVSDNGQIKISDFGLACRASNPGLSDIFEKGSADYLPPERWSGERPSPSSDVFSIGVLAYEILRGKRPLAGANPVNWRQSLDRFQEEISRSAGDPVLASWSAFFSATLPIEKNRRAAARDLIGLVPNVNGPSNAEIQKSIGLLVSPTLTDLQKHRTATQFFSKALRKRSRGIIAVPYAPWAALMFSFFCMMTSTATGLDHAVSGRLRPCLLTLTSKPWGELLVDGISRGYTPLINVPISSGVHVLVWRAGDGTEVRRTLTAFENGTLAYKIVKTKGQPLVAPISLSEN